MILLQCLLTYPSFPTSFRVCVTAACPGDPWPSSAEKVSRGVNGGSPRSTRHRVQVGCYSVGFPHRISNPPGEAVTFFNRWHGHLPPSLINGMYSSFCDNRAAACCHWFAVEQGEDRTALISVLSVGSTFSLQMVAQAWLFNVLG